jgi:L-lysine 2,3-aminomutase
MFAAGVLPYYLHMLDKVSGAAHFAVPLATARELISNMQSALPGYLVPRLVREEAGMMSKIPL